MRSKGFVFGARVVQNILVVSVQKQNTVHAQQHTDHSFDPGSKEDKTSVENEGLEPDWNTLAGHGMSILSLKAIKKAVVSL